MALYKDAINQIHDDMNGECLKIIGWTTGKTLITQAEADAILTPPKTQSQLLAEFHQQVKDALTASDATMGRIQDAVTLGNTSFTALDVVAWSNYRAALRTELSATIVSALPAKPAYPAGT